MPKPYLKTSLGFLASILILVCSLPALAVNRGSQVIVVYNSRMSASKDIAEHYAQLRHVPADQIFGFDLPTTVGISRANYTDSLEKPLARLLEKRKLWHIGSTIIRATNGHPARVVWRVKQTKIRYAVLCYGVPVRINPDPTLKEPIEAKMRPQLRRNEAAVDSELALLPDIEQDLPLAGPLSNPVYGATNSAAFSPTNGVLMVTRLDGPSARIARDLVDKAIEAEKVGMWGRAYFDLRDTSNPNYKMGDDWIRGAAEICRHLGFQTVVDDKPTTFPPGFPMSHIGFYCGWYAANACGPFARKHVEFMPGAFAYHLHSFSAAHLRSATKNWVGPFLAKGATISMGCVAEPYLGGTPNVTVFASRLIFYGMSFGEAAYASQPVLSWQTTFVGDPLYRPFGTPAQVLQARLQKEHSKYLPWSYLRIVNLNLVKGTPLASCVSFLEQLNLTRHSAILSEKLANLYQAQGKPDSAIELDERALDLHPSPEQRVRLRLTLGARLTDVSRSEDQGKYQQALKDYEALLRENPDYPNKLSIYKKMLPIARKLDDHKATLRVQERIKKLTPPPKQPENKKP